LVLGSLVIAATGIYVANRTSQAQAELQKRQLNLAARAPGRAGVAHLGSSEISYSLQVRRVLGAGSRSALPLRFSVVFEYGGLIP